MKFTDLNSKQRSMLTMLCTGQQFRTDELGRGTMPKIDPPAAAQVLMEMREGGLVYSSQKPAGTQYAQWRASDYGKRVFGNRDEDVQPQPIREVVPAAPAPQWVVYAQATIIGDSVYTEQADSEAQALDRAARLTDKLKKVFYVAKLVAAVRPVVQPTHVIERV